MADSVPSDHESVTSYRVTLATVGSTSRPQIILPEKCSCADGDLIYLSLAGTATHAQVVTTLGGERGIQGAYSNRRQARESSGENRLQAWTASTVSFGETLVLDELDAGYAYGLREPGDRIIYQPPDPPNSSLVDIAESLENV